MSAPVVPAPPPVSVRKRGPGFWILIAAGGFGGCCVLPGLGLLLLGLISSAGTTTTTVGGPVAIAQAPDDFVFTAQNGLRYVASSQVIAEGVPVTLAGEWREDGLNIVLRLHEGGDYTLENSGSVSFVNGSGAFDRADATSDAERGSWTFAQDGTLTLTPRTRDLRAISGMNDLGTSKQAVDGPRKWHVVGVTIEYSPHDGGTRQRPGLHLTGPAPSWYYPPNDWNMVVRSAPFSGD